MAGPYDYITPLAQASQLPQPQEGAAILNGINQGLAMQFGQAQRAFQIQQLQRQMSLQQQQDAAQRAALTDPTPENIVRWSIAAPDQWQATKAAHDNLNTDTQRQNVQDAASVYGYLQNDNPDAAAQILQRRYDAGQKNLGPLLSMVQSGDPTKIKAAQGVAGAMLSGFMGPDKFAEAYNATSPEALALKQAQAEQASAAANKDRFMTVNNAEGGQDVVRIDGGGQGAPAPAAGAPPAGSASATPPAQGGASAGGVAIPGPAGAKVAEVAQKVGASPAQMDYLARTAALESGGKPDAQNGSSTGVYQMQPGTFSDLGGTDINDVGQQTLATLKLASQNSRALGNMLGRGATPPEVYLAHQQGATGAAALISKPDVNAIQALEQAGVSPAKAKASILNNGGNANMTAGQFVQQWTDKYNGALSGQGAGAEGAAGTEEGPTPGSGVSVVYRSGSSSERLSPEAIDYVAQQYVSTGQMPPLGMGKVATINRNAVLNRAQQIEAETGATGYDAVARHAAMKTAQASLTQIGKTLAGVQAAEGTVDKNMNLVLSLAPKGGGPTGSPIVNAPIQYLRKNVWGSDQVASFDAAIGTVADEYAKVMTSATGTGGSGTSDSARAEAYSRLSKAATIGQLHSVMTTMRQEMSNRTQSLNEQRQDQMSILSNRGASPTGATPGGGGQGSAPVRVQTPQQAMALPPGTVFITPDGRRKVR